MRNFASSEGASSGAFRGPGELILLIEQEIDKVTSSSPAMQNSTRWVPICDQRNHQAKQRPIVSASNSEGTARRSTPAPGCCCIAFPDRETLERSSYY